MNGDGPLRVGMDVGTAGYHSGLRAYATSLARAMARDCSVEIQLHLLYNSLRGTLPEGLPGAGEGAAVSLSRLPGVLPCRALQPLLDGWVRPRQAARLRLQVYHSLYLYQPRVDCARVLTVHDLIPIDWPELVSQVFRTWFTRHLRSAAGWADVVICVSEFTRRRWLQWSGMPDDQVFTVPLGVAGVIEPETAPWESLRPTVPERYLLHVGDFQPRKNQLRLVQAYALAAPQLPDLVLVGRSSAYAEQVAAVAAGAGLERRIHFIHDAGDREVGALMDQCLAFVFPSLCEGFGLPPLEAMARGRAVLLSRRTSLPEVAGEAALYVDPNNVQELAEGLERLAADERLRETLGNAGRERAALFPWSRTAQETAAVYRTALARRAAG